MTLVESFALASLALFSYADLRYRLVPGVEFFLIGAILLKFPTVPFQIGMIVLACSWGVFRNIPGLFSLPLLFYPPTWPVLLTGYGYRKSMMGRADLLAISGLACLFPLPTVLSFLFGLELWRRLWIRRHAGNIPALPGLLSGLIIYLILRSLLRIS